MAAIKRNLLIEQGATGPEPNLFIWQNPRGVFKAIVAGTSDPFSEPVWPTANCDCDEIVDNTVTWACERTATQDDWATLSLWCPDEDYALNDLVITPKVPVDITGYTARMQIRDLVADEPDSQVFLTVTEVANANDSVILLGGTTGEIEIIIQAEDTEELDFDQATYDLELLSPPNAKYPSGKVTRLAEGRVTLSRERTRT